MRSWKTILVLACVLLIAGSAFAEVELEKKLMKEGWIKLTAQELKTLKNFTASDDVGWVEYVDPSGTKVVTQSMSGTKSKGKRTIAADGKYCHQYESNSICWYLWKQGLNYLSVEIIKPVFAPAFLSKGEQFTIKPGNTENL